MEIGSIRPTTELNQQTVATGASEELGKNQFLELMVAQFTHQDPLEPAKDEAFIAQLAQFSSLEGIQNLNISVESMASAMRSSTTVQAAALIGRSVLATAPKAYMDGEGLAGNVINDQPGSDIVVEISDAAGGLIRRLTLNSAPDGDVAFVWDGANEEGEIQPAGTYGIKAFTGSDEDVVALDVQLPERVASVSFDESGAHLNLSGGATVALSEIRELQ